MKNKAASPSVPPNHPSKPSALASPSTWGRPQSRASSPVPRPEVGNRSGFPQVAWRRRQPPSPGEREDCLGPTFFVLFHSHPMIWGRVSDDQFLLSLKTYI